MSSRGKERYTVIPYLSIKPGMLLAYSRLEPHPVREHARDGHLFGNAEAKATYEGILSPSAKKKLIKAINLLVAISRPKKAIDFKTNREFKFRINFITLTLPSAQGAVSDKELKQVALKQWIEYWRDHADGMSYVWRAERQANGNLHFHIITDRYIHYREIRDTWNKRLAAWHFIDEFERKFNHRFPNSTDVHSVQKIKNLGAYIAKYMSKSEKHAQKIDGKVWDCSKNLKTLENCAWPAATLECEYFNALHEDLSDQSFSTDHCAGIRLTEKEMHARFPPQWKSEYSAYLARIRGSE